MHAPRLRGLRSDRSATYLRMNRSSLVLLTLSLAGTGALLSAVACGDTETGPGATEADASTVDSGGSDAGAVDAAVDTGSTLDAAKQGDGAWASTCRAQAERDVRCDPAADLAKEEANCLARAACAESYRQGVIGPLTSCLNQRPCNTSDDPCFSEAGTLFGGAKTTTYVQACVSKLQGCGEAGTPFKDDYCDPALGIFADQHLDAFSACLTRPCGDVKACFSAAIIAAGCGK